ncbi:hypothetical protein CEE45_10920 [Candidatus Heimdallarchaeota archaeon B3_Heim]|nr:MAG: hypothetical protein CEE45_10920 [Candidatus Heimdallarchaeota archaeon B3_Heim]
MEVTKANSRKRKLRENEFKFGKDIPEPKDTNKTIKKHISNISVKGNFQSSVNIFLYSYPFILRYGTNYRILPPK